MIIKAPYVQYTSLRGLFYRPWQSFVILLAFILNSFGPIPSAQAQDYRLPAPGVMVHLSPEFNPPILKGIKVHSDNPFRFDFILDKGDEYGRHPEPFASLEGRLREGSQQEQLKTESTRLIKYFLASLTIPEKDLWVNLSPYEKDRIIPQSFGLTEMGRDLLAEDYMLKQITASLIYPEDAIGKKFWKRIYEESAKRYGTTNTPVNTFNKVWIVPEKAVVYENAKAGTAYVVESKLKVMLEQDYLSLQKHEGISSEVQTQGKETNQLGSQIVREIVIPELTKEVNENKNFAKLRQVYNSLILATWYKKKIKDSILAQVYADKNKVEGVGYGKNDVEAIYHRYLQAFKKGVYNYIKEETDPLTQEIIPRKYFSGGVNFVMTNNTALGIDLLKITSTKPVVEDIKSLFVIRNYNQAMKSLSSWREQNDKRKSLLNTSKSNLGKIYNMYQELLTKNNEHPKFSKEKILKRMKRAPNFIKYIPASILFGIAGLAVPDSIRDLIHGNYGAMSVDILGALILSGWARGKLLFAELTTGYNYSPLIDLTLTFYNNESNENLLIKTDAHEMAHFLKMPMDKLYASSYEVILSRALGGDEGGPVIPISRTIEDLKYFKNGPMEFQVSEFEGSLDKIKPLLKKIGQPVDTFRDIGVSDIESAVNWLNASTKPFHYYFDYSRINGENEIISNFIPEGFESMTEDQLKFLASTVEGQKLKRVILNQLRRKETPNSERGPDEEGYDIARIISDNFPGRIEDQEILLRVFTYNFLTDKDLQYSKMRIIDNLNEIKISLTKGYYFNLDALIRNIKGEWDWTYLYGAAIGYLASMHFGNEHVDEALQYIYSRSIQDGVVNAKAEPKSNIVVNANAAMNSQKLDKDLGGIDLTPANMNLQTQNAGAGIKFYLDPVILQELQDAPGFVPVIINIQPLKSLQEFLAT